MKSIREKNYTKERRKEFAKIFSLIFTLLSAVLFLVIWGVTSVNKAKEQRRVADSIANMDTIAAADAISIKNDTTIVDTAKEDTTTATDTVKVVSKKPGVYKATVNGETVKIVIKL